MEKKISFEIEDDIYDKFCLALNLSKEEESKAVETCLKWYIAKTFGKDGKVFEDDGKSVSIWSEVEEVLLEYKSYFCS